MSEVVVIDPSNDQQSAAFVRAAYVKRMREHADIVVNHIREILLSQEYLDDPELNHLQSSCFKLKFDCTRILNEFLNKETYQTLSYAQLKYIAIQFDYLGWTTYYNDHDRTVTLESAVIDEELV